MNHHTVTAVFPVPKERACFTSHRASIPARHARPYPRRGSETTCAPCARPLSVPPWPTAGLARVLSQWRHPKAAQDAWGIEPGRHRRIRRVLP